ncbi:MAG: hypothetical protein OEV26_02905, partial [Gallionella sp.]|nr:hypothetical protein [Gallionella sp.]
MKVLRVVWVVENGWAVGPYYESGGKRCCWLSDVELCFAGRAVRKKIFLFQKITTMQRASRMPVSMAGESILQYRAVERKMKLHFMADQTQLAAFVVDAQIRSIV